MLAAPSDLNSESKTTAKGSAESENIENVNEIIDNMQSISLDQAGTSS